MNFTKKSNGGLIQAIIQDETTLQSVNAGFYEWEALKLTEETESSLF